MSVRMRRIPVLVALLLAPGLGHAAGASRQRTPAPAPGLRTRAAFDVRTLCDALHGIPAERRAACCGAAAASLTDVCADALAASVARGAVRLEAVDRCAADTRRALTGCDWITPLMPALPDSCRNAIHGERHAGAACQSSLECVDGLACRGLGLGQPGVCVPPGAAGSRCAIPADTLAAFTRATDDDRHPVCDAACVKGVCVARGAVNAPQPPPTLGAACALTSCDAGAFCQNGRCVAARAAGEVCGTAAECRSVACLKAPGAALGTCSDACGASHVAHP